MVVGDNVAFGLENKSGTRTLAVRLTVASAAGITGYIEKPSEKLRDLLLSGRALLLAFTGPCPFAKLSDPDVDDGRRSLIDQAGEVRQSGNSAVAAELAVLSKWVSIF